MHDLQSVTPLGGTTPCGETYNGVSIREVTDLALASLSLKRGQEQTARSKAEAFLGAALPGPGGHVAGKPFSATWMAPDQWFVSASLPEHELLAGVLKQAVGDSASVTEQTDAWCCFVVDGPRCPDLFEKLTSIDVRAMTAGQAVRLRLEHLGCFVVCLETARAFLVLGQRSAAGSLFHALHVTAKAL